MKFINVNEPLLDGNEKKYLAECIDTGWISSEGPFVKRLEESFSHYVGRKHGVAVTNGTAAIDAAVEALGIGPGDEVIMPTFTIISCVLQVVRSGAIPVLIDSDPITWNMDINKIEEKITSRTKAIMVVHIYGLPVDLDPVIEICKKYKLKLIEDAAEMIGQTYKGQLCGSFGDISTVSFYPNKHITTGEGGMILTNDAQLADACQSLRNLCFKPGQRFVHEKLGWNLRMTNMQAAIGVAQFERLNDFLIKKRAIGQRYNRELQHLTDLQLPLVSTNYAQNIYWVFGVVLQDSAKLNAVEAIKKMEELGIGCRPFFYPLHQQPILKKMGFFNGEKYPVAEKMYDRGFYIPSGLALTDDEIGRVVSALNKVFN